MDQRGNTGVSIIAWFALVIAALALLLSWTAFNRTGEDLDQRIQRGVEQGIDTIQEQTPDAEPEQPDIDDQNEDEQEEVNGQE